MSNFSTGTSSTASCTHLSATDFRLAFVMQSGVWSMSSCPLRSLGINKYLSWVATQSQIQIYHPWSRQKYTGTFHPHSAGASWAAFSRNMSPLQVYLLTADANGENNSILVTSDQMKAEVSWCFVEGKSLSPPGFKGEVSKEDLSRGSATPWDASWAHWVATSLGLHADLLHTVNANIYKQKEEFSCHSGSYWRQRRSGDIRINTVPPKKKKLVWDTRLLWGRQKVMYKIECLCTK